LRRPARRARPLAAHRARPHPLQHRKSTTIYWCCAPLCALLAAWAAAYPPPAFQPAAPTWHSTGTAAPLPPAGLTVGSPALHSAVLAAAAVLVSQACRGLQSTFVPFPTTRARLPLAPCPRRPLPPPKRRRRPALSGMQGTYGVGLRAPGAAGAAHSAGGAGRAASASAAAGLDVRLFGEVERCTSEW
jgi:hypothetical protein